jgi:CrcB protein
MIFYVAVGSALGGVLRYLLSNVVPRSAPIAFPWSTLLINVAGSFVAGFLARWFVYATPISTEVRAMLTIGFCGGFTTFSAFSYETVMLFESGDARRGVVYALASVVLSVGAAAVGVAAARTVAA